MQHFLFLGKRRLLVPLQLWPAHHFTSRISFSSNSGLFSDKVDDCVLVYFQGTSQDCVYPLHGDISYGNDSWRSLGTRGNLKNDTQGQFFKLNWNFHPIGLLFFKCWNGANRWDLHPLGCITLGRVLTQLYPTICYSLMV